MISAPAGLAKNIRSVVLGCRIEVIVKG
jgi:hypothetical protein